MGNMLETCYKHMFCTTYLSKKTLMYRKKYNEGLRKIAGILLSMQNDYVIIITVKSGLEQRFS